MTGIVRAPIAHAILAAPPPPGMLFPPTPAEVLLQTIRDEISGELARGCRTARENGVCIPPNEVAEPYRCFACPRHAARHVSEALDRIVKRA